MNKRYRNQMLIESRVPRQKASDGPEPEIMLELSPEHPKLPQLSKTALVGSSVPGFDVIDCTHYRN